MAEMIGTPTGGGEITQDDKLWGMLSWIPFIGWIPALIVLLSEDKKTRPFMKYNAVLSLSFEVVLYVIGTITVGCLAVVGAIYAIYLAIKAYGGNWVEVPLLSDFIVKQGWATKG